MVLTAYGDGRRVASDPAARYWGIELEERTLCPGEGARLSETRLQDWLLDDAKA
jgi:hypothetical protein